MRILHPAPLRVRQPTLCSSIFPPLLFRPSLAWREFWHAGPAPPTYPPSTSSLCLKTGLGGLAGGSLLTSGAAGMPDGPIHHTGGGGREGRGEGRWCCCRLYWERFQISGEEREEVEGFQLPRQQIGGKDGKK